jgi:hypothetical protein
MKYSIITVLAAAILSVVLTTSATAKTLTIALDKSGSNPLLVDPNFAASAAGYVAAKVQALEDGDVVRLRSFGSRQAPQNLLNQSFVISRRLKARQLAEALKNFINDLPNHKSDAQPSTNIVALLEFDNGLDCANGGEVLLLTDGLEASEYMDPKAFLAGQKHLPKPDVGLTGCDVTFYGLGAGLPAPAAKFIRHEWAGFIKTAGGAFTAEMM